MPAAGDQSGEEAELRRHLVTVRGVGDDGGKDDGEKDVGERWGIARRIPFGSGGGFRGGWRSGPQVVGLLEQERWSGSPASFRSATPAGERPGPVHDVDGGACASIGIESLSIGVVGPPHVFSSWGSSSSDTLNRLGHRQPRWAGSTPRRCKWRRSQSPEDRTQRCSAGPGLV